MATFDLSTIMDAVEDAIATTGLRIAETLYSETPVPAAAVRVPDLDEYRSTMQRGRIVMAMSVYVLISAAWSRTGQRELAAYASPVGPKSIALAVEADRTLGGTVDDATVTSFSNLDLEEVSVLGYFGGRFDLKLILKGSP